MRTIRLSKVPFILQVHPITKSETLALTKQYSTIFPDNKGYNNQFEKDLQTYSDFAGYYLADESSVEKMGWDYRTLSTKLHFKRISERGAYHFGLAHADRVKFHFGGSLIIPPSPESLDKLVKEETAIIRLNRASGLASIKATIPLVENSSSIYTSLTKEHFVNFLHPFCLEGFSVHYAHHGEGLQFSQEDSFLLGEYAKYLPKE